MINKTKTDRKNRNLMEKGGGRGDSDEDTNFDADFIEKTRKAVESHCSGKSPEWCYGFKRGMDYGRLDAFDDSMNKPTRGKSGDYSEKSGSASDAKVADVDRESLLYGMSKDALTGYKAGYSFGHSNAQEDMKRGMPDTFTKEMVQEKKWKSCMDIPQTPKAVGQKPKETKGGGKNLKAELDVEDSEDIVKKGQKTTDKKFKSCMRTDKKECKLTEGLFKKWHALLFTDDEDAEISDEFPATFMYALGAMKTISALTAEAKKEFRDLIKGAEDIDDEEAFLDILKKLDEFGETYGLWTPSFVESYENSEDDEEEGSEEGFEDSEDTDSDIESEEGFEDMGSEESGEADEEEDTEAEDIEEPEDDEMMVARREARRRVLRRKLQESRKQGKK